MSPVLSQLAVPVTSVHKVEADGVEVFYRAAGDPGAPVVLLLHGFPTSSFMFRELIPRLADQFRVIAPDLPGFGFTEVPEKRQYQVFVRRIGAHDGGLHRCARPQPLCDLCFRLRGSNRLPSGDGSPRTSVRYCFAERQCLRRGARRCVGTDSKILGGCPQQKTAK